ncbi:MAG: hypothetical protein ACI3ZN_10840 [Candidatus Cryptobacteroides sp.]
MKHYEKYHLAIAILILVALFFGCSAPQKLSKIKKGEIPLTQIALSHDKTTLPVYEDKKVVVKDTLKIVEDDGTEILIMKAVRDEETGEMVATDVLDAAKVTARFRNVAERHGVVDLKFQVIVPRDMIESKWQLRFHPDLFVLGDSTRLDPIIVTGSGYRKAQLRGYQHYERFLSKIVEDTTKFINVNQLEIFLKRNIPQIYAFKTDTSYVSHEDFQSCFGVTQKQAIDHYTNKFAKERNNARIRRKSQMFNKYVKAPIVKEGIRLDTVIVDASGDFIYDYVQTINVRPKLRKADIVLSGEIYEQDKRIFSVPATEPLTFYISSVSALLDGTQRYKTKIIERRVSTATNARIEFAEGRSEINIQQGDNAREITNIRKILSDLVVNEVFEIDSIVVSATASPEGNYSSNAALAQRRSESVSTYFNNYVRSLRDSLEAENGRTINLDDTWTAEKKVDYSQIRFTPHCIPENWEDLDEAIKNDDYFAELDRKCYQDICLEPDPDAREAKLKRMPFYKHLKDEIYPRLRLVKFKFHLHRRGMVKDTVQTTVLDTAYMNGVQCLRDMDYAAALQLLKSYADFNTAIAYMGMDMNVSALSILEGMERSDKVNYLLAILYSRTGNMEKAVECYVKSCRQNGAYVHRGNLDPEISILIKEYGLNKDDEEEL